MALVPPASFPCKAANEQHFHHHVLVNADSEWWFRARVPTFALRSSRYSCKRNGCSSPCGVSGEAFL
jgi:hypothetical protein